MILNSKNATLTILKLIIQIWLLGLFLYFFGFPALKKYQEKKVLVVTSKRNTNGTQAPALAIVVKRKETKTGWKKEGFAHMGSEGRLYSSKSTNGGKGLKNSKKKVISPHVEKKCQSWGCAGFVPTLCKDANSTETIVSCIEQQTYNLSEIIASVTLGDTVQGFSNEVKNPNWTEDFTHNYAGRAYILDLPINLRSFSFSENALTIGLKAIGNNGDNDVNYEIYIHDPTFFHVTRNPEPVHPSIREHVDFETLPRLYSFALTEVEELNIPDDPCNEDPDYNFRKCLKESFTRRIGCRTKWDDVQLKDLPLCASITQFK